MPRGGARRNAGRPCKGARTHRVWVRLRPELLAEIERLAALHGRAPGELLSVFVETGMLAWSEERERLLTMFFD